MPPPCSWRASYRAPSSSRTATETASGRSVRTTQPAEVKCVPSTPCGSYDQPSTTARRSSPLTSRASGEGAEWPVSSAADGAGGCTGAPVGSPGSATGAGATTGAAVVRLAGAFFAAAFLAVGAFLAVAAFLAAGAFFAAVFLAAVFLAAAFLAGGSAFTIGSLPAAASAAAVCSSTARWRASLSAIGGSPRSSVVIFSPSSWVLGGAPVASLAAGQPGQGVQRDHQPVRTVACLVDALVNRFVRLERPKEW